MLDYLKVNMSQPENEIRNEIEILRKWNCKYAVIITNEKNNLVAIQIIQMKQIVLKIVSILQMTIAIRMIMTAIDKSNIDTNIATQTKDRNSNASYVNVIMIYMYQVDDMQNSF